MSRGVAFAGVVASLLLMPLICVMLWEATQPKGLDRMSAWMQGATYIDGQTERQRTRNDCAVACTAMYLKQSGLAVKYDELAQELRLTRKGASMQQIVDNLHRHGAAAEYSRVHLTEMENLPVPSIVLVHHDHFVVLGAVTPHTVTVLDPAIGRIRAILKSLPITGVQILVAKWLFAAMYTTVATVLIDGLLPLLLRQSWAGHGLQQIAHCGWIIALSMLVSGIFFSFFTVLDQKVATQVSWIVMGLAVFSMGHLAQLARTQRFWHDHSAIIQQGIYRGGWLLVVGVGALSVLFAGKYVEQRDLSELREY